METRNERVREDATILVVEDERIVAKDLQRSLERLGYQVPVAAASADEAIRQASERVPDLVLMDIRIKGGRDGIDTAEILRRRFDVPVIYLTAYADETTLARAKRTAPYAYLLKPVRMDELRSAVELALYRHRAEQRIRQGERWLAAASRSVHAGEGAVPAGIAGGADQASTAGTLIAGLAHEVSDPLGLVLANLHLAFERLQQRKDPDGEDAELAAWRTDLADAIVGARSAAERAKAIVAEYMAMSRQDSAPGRRIDARQVVSWAIRVAAHELPAGARVATELDDDVPAVIADASRLAQVIVELLHNAAQSLTIDRPRGNEIRVTLGVEPEGWVVIEVHDTGHGISEDALGRVFEPFYTTKGADGAGLGLPCAQGIVRSLGGRITVESRVGNGSTFRVLLPAAPPERSDADTVAKETPRASILAIDDDPMIQRAIERALDREHTVTSPIGPRAALTLIQSGRRYDIILCDLLMEGLTGMDLYQEILRRDPDQARRMIFLTGGSFTTRTLEFLLSVEHPTIEKPFDPPRLRRLVRDVLLSLGPLAKE